MILRISSKRQKLGLSIYFAGMLVYLSSWILMVYFPDSTWGRSAIGSTAPAWTTLFWLVGIGLVGDQVFLNLPYRPWVYLLASLLFVIFHTAHATLVYLRIS